MRTPPTVGRPSRRPRQWELVALDAVAAAGFALLFVAGSSTVVPLIPGPPSWLELPVLAGVTVPLVIRRLRPVPVLTVVAVAAVLSLGFGRVLEPLLCVAFALYPVAQTAPARGRGVSIAVSALSAVLILGGAVTGGVPASLLPAVRAGLLGTIALGMSWALGRAVRQRRLLAVRAVEQVAALAVERAVIEERLRIARELHDVVSHSLSLIGVKAAVARHLAGTHPEELVPALEVIETAGNDALVEMRRMLGVLRSGADGDRSDEPDAGLRLDDLTAWAGEAGVQVEMTVHEPERVPAELAGPVRRIVQEAVTNVVRHAAPANCWILVRGSEEEVQVEVTDDGPGGAGQDGDGLGLVGMRERVALHGGSFSAGPRSEGGFAVRARIPVRS